MCSFKGKLYSVRLKFDKRNGNQHKPIFWGSFLRKDHASTLAVNFHIFDHFIVKPIKKEKNSLIFMPTKGPKFNRQLTE